MSESGVAQVGLIGLAVMGKNLALNIADHGFDIAVFNRTTAVTQEFIKENPDTPGKLVGCDTPTDFVLAIKKPRVIIILVKAGAAVDGVTQQLIEAGVDKNDIVIDAGNRLAGFGPGNRLAGFRINLGGDGFPNWFEMFP